jgi:hypothetical protein
MVEQKKSSNRMIALTTLVVFLVVGLLAGENFLRGPQAEGRWVFIKEQPTLIITPIPVPYQRKVRVTLAGSGYEPKQELSLKIDLGGVPSDISYMLRPRPVPNEFGAFSAEWIIDGEIGGKLLDPTAYTLRVEDEHGFVLAHAPLVFAEVKKEKKEKKEDPKAEKKAEKKAAD